MKVAHIIPPRWERRLGRGSYRMTFVPWVLQNPGYARELKAEKPYIILDHGLFENDLSIPTPEAIALVAATLDPCELVLPDVLGDHLQTLEAALEFLKVVPLNVRVMFVPQARTLSDWKGCLDAFLHSSFPLVNINRRPTIGLSSLRRATGLRAQVGTRILMMKYIHDRGFRMHLLGLCSVKHFFEEELPAALQYGVRGVDTCAAFTLGARGLKLDRRSPRLFLGDIGRYKFLSHDEIKLVNENIQTLNDWVKGD